MFAVIQTAATTPNADVVAYKDDDGNRVPAVLFMHAERAKCEKRRKTLLRLASRIRAFKGTTGTAVIAGMPVLGVCEIEIEEGVKRPRAKKPDSANGTGTPTGNSLPTATPGSPTPASPNATVGKTTVAKAK